LAAKGVTMSPGTAPRALVISALSLGTGSGLRAKYLAAALSRLGWQVRLAAPGGPPLPFSAEMLHGSLQCVWAGLYRYDLAVAVKGYPDAWLGLAAARARGALAVLDIDDDDGGYRGGALGALTRLIQAPGFGVASMLSTHHPLLKEALQARNASAFVLDLPQGVDLGIFDGRAMPLDDAPRLAFTAHLNVACQLDVLLDALGPWLLAHPTATLTVAGGGPDEEKFRALAAPLGAQVSFLGTVSPRQAAECLAAAHVSVSAYGPSEGNRYRVPMKVAESLAMGTPVVTNMVPGLEPLRPYLFVSSLEPQAYGQAIDAALADGRTRSLQGQAYVRTHLDWTLVTAAWLAQIRREQDLPRGLHETP
jgi:glycosyltransferase involved in cell wall biosynthesis